jgi:hypothetical protein
MNFRVWMAGASVTATEPRFSRAQSWTQAGGAGRNFILARGLRDVMQRCPAFLLWDKVPDRYRSLFSRPFRLVMMLSSMLDILEVANCDLKIAR